MYLKNKNICIIGADCSSKNILYSKNRKFDFPIAVVFGSEGFGLRDLTKKNCDELVRIPSFGKISVLNVSVSVGIFLFEIIRNRLFSVC
ncbi:hypothetical protein AOQ89_02475 [bacterium endosymbiont of Pedicinus badii]|nr:hypothetical protein AOQ89_02475 [bacterium endosymbiont of Pedicinus badii]